MIENLFEEYKKKIAGNAVQAYDIFISTNAVGKFSRQFTHTLQRRRLKHIISLVLSLFFNFKIKCEDKCMEELKSLSFLRKIFHFVH